MLHGRGLYKSQSQSTTGPSETRTKQVLPIRYHRDIVSAAQLDATYTHITTINDDMKYMHTSLWIYSLCTYTFFM